MLQLVSISKILRLRSIVQPKSNWPQNLCNLFMFLIYNEINMFFLVCSQSTTLLLMHFIHLFHSFSPIPVSNINATKQLFLCQSSQHISMCVCLHTLYSDCLRRESNFLASTHRVTVLCMHVCCIVCVCDCVMVIRKPMRK